MEDSYEENNNEEKVPELAMGIDFGTNNVIAYVWDVKKRKAIHLCELECTLDEAVDDTEVSKKEGETREDNLRKESSGGEIMKHTEEDASKVSSRKKSDDILGGVQEAEFDESAVKRNEPEEPPKDDPENPEADKAVGPKKGRPVESKRRPGEREQEGARDQKRESSRKKTATRRDKSTIENKKIKITNIKQLLGKTSKEIDNQKFPFEINKEKELPTIMFGSRELTPEEIAAKIIEKTFQRAEEEYKVKPTSVVVSLPHCSNNSQRNAMKNVLTILNVNKKGIINDMLATALGYASEKRISSPENILIIDFGGSKIDTAIMNIRQNYSIKTLATKAELIGGAEITHDIYRYVNSKLKNKFASLDQDLLEKCEKAKRDLSGDQAKDAVIQLDIKGEAPTITITVDKFNEIVSKFSKNILDVIEEVISTSGIQKTELNCVLLLGGVMNIQKIQNDIKSYFEDIEVLTEPSHAVAIGSAIYAAKAIEQIENEELKRMKLFDITPLSIGVRVQGDLMSVLIPRGMRYPVEVKKNFITTQDYQTVMKFEIYEGERKFIKDNHRLCRTMLKNLPKDLKGKVSVDLYFSINEECTLKVTAEEVSTKQTVETTTDEFGNKTQEQIDDMIKTAKEKKEEDEEEEKRIQAQIKFNDTLLSLSHKYEEDEEKKRTIETYKNWMKHNLNAPIDTYREREKEVLSKFPEKEKEVKSKETTKGNKEATDAKKEGGDSKDKGNVETEQNENPTEPPKEAKQ